MNRDRGKPVSVLPAPGRLLLGIAAAAACFGFLGSALASAQVIRPSDHAAIGVQLHVGTHLSSAVGEAPAHATQPLIRADDSTPAETVDPDVTSQGGPVLHTIRPYLVFWDPNDLIPETSRKLLEQYLTDVATDSGEADDVYGVGRQYYDSTGIADAGQSFYAATQAINDGDPYPPEDATCQGDEAPHCLSDPQVQDELQNLIASRSLPTGIGPGAPVYFVITPSDTDVCLPPTTLSPGPACASNNVCSYHSYFEDGPADVIYAVIPILPVQDNPKDCQQDGTAAPQEPNGDIADIVIDDLSHESNESITDPIPGTGWYDPSTGNEAADNCEMYPTTTPPVSDPAAGESVDAYTPLGGDQFPQDGAATYGTLFDQVINGDKYYTQTLWSDGNGNCEASPDPGEVTSAFSQSTVAVVGQSMSFNPTASTASNGVSSETLDFGDGTSKLYPGAPTQITHTYEADHAYTASLTVVDSDGNIATSTRTVTVLDPLEMSMNGSPAQATAGQRVVFQGSATDPNPGGAIAFYRWSFGKGNAGAFGPRASFAFKNAGTYHVTLTATDTLGVQTPLVRSFKVVAGRIMRVVSFVRGSAHEVSVTVNAPGTVSIGGPSGASAHIDRAGTVTLPVRLTATQARAQSRGGHVTIRVRVIYTPSVGPAVAWDHTTTFLTPRASKP